MKINKGLLSLGIGVALISALNSCGSGEQQFFSFQSFSLSTVAEGSDNDSVKDEINDFNGMWDVSISGIQPIKIGPNELTELNDTLGLMMSVDFTADPAVIKLPEELVPLASDSTAVSPKSKLMKRLTLDLLNTNVAVFRVYSYALPEGAAHGIYANKFVNYNISAGDIINLSTLFKPDFAQTLQPMIVQRLKEKHREFLVNEEEIEVTSNIRVTDNGIDFIYGVYSIAPYSDGEPVVSFNAYELSDLLTDEGKKLLGI